jgi:hypothetical protein
MDIRVVLADGDGMNLLPNLRMAKTLKKKFLSQEIGQ